MAWHISIIKLDRTIINQILPVKIGVAKIRERNKTVDWIYQTSVIISFLAAQNNGRAVGVVFF